MQFPGTSSGVKQFSPVLVPLVSTSGLLVVSSPCVVTLCGALEATCSKGNTDILLNPSLQQTYGTRSSALFPQAVCVPIM